MAEEVKHVSKIYVQLKFFMKEESLTKHAPQSECHKKSQKYAGFLKRLHDICVVKMLTSQSELMEPGSSNEDLSNSVMFARRAQNIQKRITNLILDMPMTPSKTDPKRADILSKINEKRAQ